MRTLSARTIWQLFAASWAFLNSVAFSVTGIYYVNEVGLNPLELILIGTAMESAAFLFEIPTGVVADVYSRRGSVVVGVFLTGLAILLIGAFPLFYTVAAGAFCFGLASFILTFWVLPAIVAACTPFSYREVYRASRDALWPSWSGLTQRVFGTLDPRDL